eukprot:TRINITY_DN32207_c0_g1_i1.p1 TRINITY_DN32207_c0_g1~~TRINITY_DN32207_c0_g1_i1.p1  ORF type:complete len:233 (+),score=56.19 TRINITY_DN32207_c0_g1_i1:81-779(+)
MASELASASVTAALNGRGTCYGVTENAWSRELTADGRIYYYDKATGCTQWHLPNDLYQSQTSSGKGKGSTQGSSLIFPAEARAMLRVDCVTEPAPAGGTTEGAFANSRGASIDPEAIIRGAPAVVLDKLKELLPPPLAQKLTSNSFTSACLADFHEVAGDSALLRVEDAAAMVCAVAAGLRVEPHLSLFEDKCVSLADNFDTASAGIVGPEEFIRLLQYIVAVRYVERCAEQ